MAQPYPLPRETRSTGVLAFDGASQVFGPVSFKIFDTEDVKVWLRHEDETFFTDVTDSVTVTKTAAAAYDTVSVDFGEVHPSTSVYVIQGARVPERSVAVTKGGGINSGELEKELSKLATEDQEIRRDLGRAFMVPPGATGGQVADIPAGNFFKTDSGGNLVNGGSAADVSSAQTYAEQAKASEAVLSLYASVVADYVAQHPRHFRYETGGDDTVLRELEAAGGEYKAFPLSMKLLGSTVLATWWRGLAHSPNVSGGDQKGQFEAAVSVDGMRTWSTPVAVYGNIDNGDDEYPYWQALGPDRMGRGTWIMGIHDGAGAVRPHIVRSLDGVGWGTPVEMTITGSVDVTAGSLTPFGTITLTPDGKMQVPMYQGDFNWVGIIDDDVSETTMDLSTVVVESSSPAFSEFAICEITAMEKLYFMRQDGATNSIPIKRTVNGGATITDFGDSGLAVGGGYVVQAAFPFVICGMLHIGLLVGIRKSVSAPIEGSPGVLLAVTSYKDLIESSSDPIFHRVHVWPLADDGENRDAYAGLVFDQETCSLGIVTHEETGEFTSRILAGAVNIGDALYGQPVQPKRAWTPVIEGATTVGSNTYDRQEAYESRVGPYASGWFDVELSVVDSTGALQVTGFLNNFADDQEIEVQVAIGLAASIERVSLGPVAGTNTAVLLEREGLSQLLPGDLSGSPDFRLRCSYRYRVEGA